MKKIAVSLLIFVSLLIAAAHVFSDRLPVLKTAKGQYYDLKLWIKPKHKPDPKIIILAIDEKSLETIGRWPWDRNYIAFLTNEVMKLNPKVFAFDMVFAEAQHPVPEDLENLLAEKGLEEALSAFQYDEMLGKTIKQYEDRIVLGWFSDLFCYQNETCPKTLLNEFDPIFLESLTIPHNLETRELKQFPRVVTTTTNIEEIQESASQSGFFVTTPDADGTLRRQPLVMNIDGKLYPSLALASLRADPQTKDLQIKNGKLFYNDKSFEVTKNGELWINFENAAFSFEYIAAIDVLQNAEKFRNKLEGAYVFLAATATGINDIRSFPLSAAAPGVEGHAWMLQNFLNGRIIQTLPNIQDSIILGMIGLIALVSIALFFVKTSLFLILGTCVLLASLFGLDFYLFTQKLIHFDFLLAYLQILLLSGISFTSRYISEEKEKRFIKGAFGRYVSPKVVDEIVKNPDLLSLGGEKREMSIFFSDIRGFTTFSERLDPAQLANFLNEYLTLMTDIIVKEFDGTLDKYIGDAIMAFWNAPLGQKDHKTLAVKAAMKMQKVLREKFEYFKSKYDVECMTGIGINSGHCIAGNMGSQMNFNYTVIGDSVNLASRVEGLTKFYGVETLITENTFQNLQIEDKYIRPLDLVKVKGKKEAVSLLQISDEPFSSEFKDTFKKAREAYLSRQFEQSAQLFEQSLTIYKKDFEKKDVASELFIERSKEFIQTPPPANWNGSLEMKTK